ncbi:hypothetical protein BDV26DRAFT_294999 [Aspergillus bertholletiae]|uniref:Uncharacterized protein n=1 Tax=Aspergillus bertholletiae TaxID=1226010 RepID=A0A5N7B303_9EURO|nr:hypothetical protein BDV26DRAFT_294999 [Aspergillus bertholletiae]
MPPKKQPTQATTTRTTTLPPCEFTTPCPAPSEASNPRRKVISHLFGRNKHATKRFPEHVWVHYCRQHYQRARYRVEWPATQCELLMVVLGRMERWGGVQAWEVVLRKREMDRLKEMGEVVPSSPTTATATATATTSTSTSTTPAHSDPTTYVNDSRGNEHDHITPSPMSISPSPMSSGPTTTTMTPSSTSSTGRRRKPTVTASPVPRWLLAKLGSDKSFTDLRDLVRHVREDIADSMGAEAEAAGGRVVFPDIELLPTFQPWVLEPVKMRRRRSGGRGRGGRGKKGSRVNGKGGVKRI